MSAEDWRTAWWYWEKHIRSPFLLLSLLDKPASVFPLLTLPDTSSPLKMLVLSPSTGVFGLGTIDIWGQTAAEAVLAL